jgi:glycolate oxidase FAD binding subunit
MIATATYTLGDRAPQRVEEPADAGAVAALLHAASAASEAVVAFGGGTLQSLGNGPARYDVALSLARLDRIAAYDHRDLTIGIEAGMSLAAIQATLAEHGQFIPFDAPLPARATVGGTLASGWAGPRRAAYGRLRDLVIGSTVALADGTLASAGGMVVKNVTGYDMSKLYVGSLGTLAVVTRANFKALPKPPVLRMALAPLPEKSRERAVNAIAHLAIEPTAALVVDGFFSEVPRFRDEDARLLVMFEGSAVGVERATRDLRSALGAAGVAETTLSDGASAERLLQTVIDATIANVSDRSLTYRSTGLPSNVMARAHTAAVTARASGLNVESIVDLRTGDLVIRAGARSHAGLAEALAEFDPDLRRLLPQVSVLAGDARLRACVDAWPPVPATIATMRDLKRRFDPANILAPGRYVGGI